MTLLQLVLLFFFVVVCNAVSITSPNIQEAVGNATFNQFRLSNEELKQAFEKFKLDYGRVYKTEEEEKQRFSAFVDNFMFVQKVNYLYGQRKSSYGTIINQFSDMTKNEMEGNDQFIQSAEPHQINQSKMYSNFNFFAGLPEHLDWRDYNYVTPIKNQGGCGSCYIFAAIGCLESHIFRKTGKLWSLSEQQILDCGPGLGCRGSEMYKVYEYIRDNGGINRNKDYPYVAGKKHKIKRSCHFDKNNITVKIQGYFNVTPRGDEEMLKYYVATAGPVSVDVDARHKEFFHYHKGIIDIPNCKTKAENLIHSGVIIGYGVEDDIPYWLIKNSWGARWGMQGFYKLRRNANNMCGVATTAVFPLV